MSSLPISVDASSPTSGNASAPGSHSGNASVSAYIIIFTSFACCDQPTATATNDSQSEV